VQNLESVLAETHELYVNTQEGLNFFRSLHKLLWKDVLDRKEKIMQIQGIIEEIWARFKSFQPDLRLTNCKSFLPNSKTPYWKILGEWVRLWKSYQPGLFRYYEFPKSIRSNVEMEQKFSVETQRFRSQSGKAHIGQMIESRGAFVLRLEYCTDTDLNFKIIFGDSRKHLSSLQEQLQNKIKKSSKRWTISQTATRKYEELLKKMYDLSVTKLTGRSQ
ncbi:MAG: hypothetical protein KAR20_14155, partial [Candidatus Heimdallarchaeota archaeon]|nr:hypothetical protein [Candidatus Heimdallarchaeota archaeon]